MKYYNKYATAAAYTADANRPTTESTISLIEDGTGVKFDGKNVLVEKAAAEIGDICVYNKDLLRKQFIKYGTFSQALLPTNLVVGGVVYYRTENRVHIVSTNNTAAARWAQGYEVRLSGFDFSSGGTFTITSNTLTTTDIVYTSSDNLTTTATLIQNALNAGAASTALKNWTATPGLDYIAIEHNYHTPALTTVSVTNSVGNIIAETLTPKDYQKVVTGVVTPYGGVTRNDGGVSWAGGNFEKFRSYYYTSGENTATNQAVGTGNPIRFSRYNATDNALIVAYYGEGEAGYSNYIQAKMVKYPYSKNGIRDRNGQSNTDILASVVYLGPDMVTSKPAYPACYNAKRYGILTVGHTTGFEPGNWWLPSTSEMYLLIKDRKVNNSDRVNVSLTAISGADKMLSSGVLYWTSSEYSSYSSWGYNGINGTMLNNIKGISISVRSVSAF